MTKLKFITLALLGAGLSQAVFAQTYSPSQVADAIMQRHNTVLRNSGQARGNNLWTRMRSDFKMSEVNPEIVRRHESYYASRSAYFNRTVARSRPYLYHILNEVEKRSMPAEIALLPFIESSFVTQARSRVGASGLWQFMPATGRHYGLTQNHVYDGRHDIYASTDAALNYLQYLYGLFGDWSLALAAYNWGEGNVSRAIARAQAQGLDPVYENLRMPNETRNYVPKLLAVRNIVNNPSLYGIDLGSLDNKPYFEAVIINKPIDINAITRLANISRADFDALNPGFKLPVFIPNDGQRKLLLPVGAVNRFERNLASAPPEALLSYDIFRTGANTNLSEIANLTGMSLADLRRTNGLSRNSVGAGSNILVAKGSLSRVPSQAVQMLAQTGHTVVVGKSVVLASNASREAAAPNPATLVVAAPIARPVVNTPSNALAAADIQITPTRSNPELSRIQVAQSAPAPASPIAAPALQPANDPLMALANAGSARQSAASTEANRAVVQVAEATSQAAPEPALQAANEPAQPEARRNQPTEIVIAQAEPIDPSAAVRASLAQTQAEEERRLAAARAVAQREQARAARATAQATTHKVQAGESLYAIAQRYNISVADLSTANNLRGNNIRPGQVLKVAGNSRSAGNSRNSASRMAVRETSYTVRPGDTLNSIARRYNVSIQDIRRRNNLTSTVLRPGQKITLMGL